MWLEERFGLLSDLEGAAFDIAALDREDNDATDELIAFLTSAWRAGDLAAAMSALGKMPTPAQLALEAQHAYLRRAGLGSLDPFTLDRPGDVLRHISCDIEYELFKSHQRRLRAAALVPIVLGGTAVTGETVIDALVRRYGEVDAVLLSASQQRRARAGASFELHIERLLVDGRINYERQVVVGTRRPDFVLPTLRLYRNRRSSLGLVLSSKTTVRERWKQVVSEMGDCPLFLATRDPDIAATSIREMRENNITLIVPERLVADKLSEYKNQPNVISFREFFRDELKARRMPAWHAAGILASTQPQTLGSSGGARSLRVTRRRS